MKKLARDPESYVLIAAVGFSALVSILDFSGLLGAIPWLATRIPTLILLLVSMTLGYLVLERRNKLEAMETLVRTGNQETLTTMTEGVDQIITALQGVDVRLFERREDFFIYLQQRIKKAKRSIDVSHFGLSSPAIETTPAGQQYYDVFSKVVKEDRIKTRRIVVVRDQGHIEWVRQMLTDLPGNRFFLSCYFQPSDYIPLLNLIIIDGEEVCIGGGERIPSYEVKTVSIKHPLFTKVIQEHFEKLWRDSTRLNERGVRPDLLDQLTSTLSGQQSNKPSAPF